MKAPKAKTTVIQGRKVVYFPFFHCFRDLLRSSVFDDANNLCVNEDKDDRFEPFVPTSNKDVGEVMAKRWARETRDGIQDFNVDQDLLLAVMIYGDKTGTDVNQRYSLEQLVSSHPSPLLTCPGELRQLETLGVHSLS